MPNNPRKRRHTALLAAACATVAALASAPTSAAAQTTAAQAAAARASGWRCIDAGTVCANLIGTGTHITVAQMTVRNTNGKRWTGTDEVTVYNTNGTILDRVADHNAGQTNYVAVPVGRTFPNGSIVCAFVLPAPGSQAHPGCVTFQLSYRIYI